LLIQFLVFLFQYNITKTEYLQAYAEYMNNVKNRKLANRGLIGVKDRRKKAVSISKTYHDNGTGTLRKYFIFQADEHLSNGFCLINPFKLSLLPLLPYRITCTLLLLVKSSSSIFVWDYLLHVHINVVFR